MAGSLVVVEADRQQSEMPLSTIRGQWQVLFARFIDYPSMSSACSYLVPLRKRASRGNWTATSHPVALLQIISEHSASEAIIAVSLSGKILEEHYISNLQFSWPQVHCIPEFPARGSRAVFVSYKDSANEIQKFALRFSTLNEAESFMNTLRENLSNDEPLNKDFGSEFSTQSEFISNNELPSRACQELCDITATDSYTPEMPSYSYESEQQSFNQEAMLNHNAESIFPALPPSFTSLVIDCCSNAKPDIAADKPTASEETDLKSQIVRYMEDSSFRDMLSKVEKIISEIGGI